MRLRFQSLVGALYLALLTSGYAYVACAHFTAARPGRGDVVETRITTVVVPTAGRLVDRMMDRASSLDGLSHISTTSSTPSTSLSTAPGMEVCWRDAHCKFLFSEVHKAFRNIGGLVNPNDGSQSEAYQQILSLTNELSNCQACYKAASLDRNLTTFLSTTFTNFCATRLPSLYLFLRDVLTFLEQAQAPQPFVHDVLGTVVPGIRTLESRFTSRSGLNQGPTKSASASGTGMGTVSVTTTTAEETGTTTGTFYHPPSATVSPTTPTPPPHPLIPIFATVLPPSWPYTSFAPARHPSLTATFTLRPAANETHTQTLILAPLLWHPRPLHTKPGPRPPFSISILLGSGSETAIDTATGTASTSDTSTRVLSTTMTTRSTRSRGTWPPWEPTEWSGTTPTWWTTSTCTDADTDDADYIADAHGGCFAAVSGGDGVGGEERGGG
ncbi:hypothetical protein BDV95DRAFT_603999 [Massariosphaeria phaeospora]|uniref:Uncharacterized protein n=1 Tax=Massariosphaeria phaeospora TaxID=100035 RepID=A0A7C8MEW6_9PLEO|nr:hypothetical protein BDV95DRAFT_603999 [Massariosphaeria phaeospora]